MLSLGSSLAVIFFSSFWFSFGGALPAMGISAVYLFFPVALVPCLCEGLAFIFGSAMYVSFLMNWNWGTIPLFLKKKKKHILAFSFFEFVGGVMFFFFYNV